MEKDCLHTSDPFLSSKDLVITGDGELIEHKSSYHM